MSLDIDLIRHGKVETPNLFCAPSTEPLSELGWQQLQQLTECCRVERVLSSPSQRCAAFADDFCRKHQLDLQLEPAFQEINFGDWIGCSTADIWQSNPSLLQQLWTAPRDFTAPNGEAMNTFIARVQSAWQRLTAEPKSERILLFTHGGVIRVILSTVLGLEYAHSLRFDLGYGQAVRIRIYPEGTASVYGLGIKQLP